MNSFFKHMLLMLLLASTLICKGQKNLTTFGFTYKPMIAGSLINEGESIEKENNIEYEVTKLFGYNAGMVIRHNFTKMFALETGISFTKRNFKMTVNDLSNNYFFEREFATTAYEIPIQGLVYVQLNKQIFMDGTEKP